MAANGRNERIYRSMRYLNLIKAVKDGVKLPMVISSDADLTRLLEIVSKRMNMPISEIISNDRHTKNKLARQIFMVIAIEKYNDYHSSIHIAAHVNRSHSTLLNSIEYITRISELKDKESVSEYELYLDIRQILCEKDY